MLSLEIGLPASPGDKRTTFLFGVFDKMTVPRGDFDMRVSQPLNPARKFHGNHKQCGLLQIPTSSATTSGAGTSSGGFGGVLGSTIMSSLTKISNTLKEEASNDPFLCALNARQEAAADILLLSAEKGELPAVEAALNAGVDPNRVAGRNGFTPLHHAVQRGHVPVTRLLLQQGRAGVNAATSDTLETPLHIAAFHGHLELATMLLDCGADPNARDSDGETLLFVAVRRGNCPPVTDLLLSRRADPSLRNRFNEIAIDDVREDDDATLMIFKKYSESRIKAPMAGSIAAVDHGQHLGGFVRGCTTLESNAKMKK